MEQLMSRADLVIKQSTEQLAVQVSITNDQESSTHESIQILNQQSAPEHFSYRLAELQR